MDEFLKTYWQAGVAVIMTLLLIRERWLKTRGDGLANKKSALELVQAEVKALSELVERKDKEHRDELREREKDWRLEIEKKDKEHREASEKNTALIADLRKDLAVYQNENKQKDEKIKELKAVVENRNPRLENLLESLEKGQKETLEFMKKNVIANIK